MNIEVIELAQLLLNYSATQWDANANNKRIELRTKAEAFEIVSIDRDCNGYESELVLFTEKYLGDLLNQMRWHVRSQFISDKMY